jgi:MoaA/NifB/PqqE/SkfB family radical SAM enzyme
MDVLALGNRVLGSRAGDLLLAVGNRLLYVDGMRKPLVHVLDRWLRAHLDDRGQAPRGWNKIARQRRLIYLSVLHTVDRVIEKRILSPQVARVIARLWGRALCALLESKPAVQRFRRQYGFDPPWFLTLSPGHACNLRCTGCYANSGPEPSQAKLPWSTLDRIMTEAKELWGVPLFVISGGEPLAYRSQGKDVLDAVRKHADCLFLMFTNGTLIDRETAVRLSRLGNLTPALSVEGLRERTDQRRGAGTFDRVLNAMADLREAGVPFGISITATRDNCAEILSDEFLDFFFAEQGAFYGFLFQYMPIGQSLALDWVPTPEQRVAFWQRSWQVVATKHIFLLDFWNHGPLVEGCISAGRDRGYIYIDWNGKVMPCVFVPYAAASVQEIYAQGGTLNDLWEAPFFQAIRQWQREYGYGRQELSRECNWMRPCPLRDHYDTLREWIDRYQPEPEDEAARAALMDEGYRARMAAYSAEMARVSQEIWDVEYLG